MKVVWLSLAVIFYPVAALAWPDFWLTRIDRLSAIASGLIVFLLLWLYVLPRDLAFDVGFVEWHSRFVLPLTAYLSGLVVAALLLAWTERRRP